MATSSLGNAMSVESLALAEADLVGILRRLHQCRRELEEKSHDAAAAERLQLEIAALNASKESARQLRDAEHASLQAKIASTPPEPKSLLQCDVALERCQSKYCQRTPENYVRLLTLAVVFALFLWYFIIQALKVDSSARNPLVQNTQTPADLLVSPSVFVCLLSERPYTFSFPPDSCVFGVFPQVPQYSADGSINCNLAPNSSSSCLSDCTPSIKVAKIRISQWGFDLQQCLIIPSVTMFKHAPTPIIKFYFSTKFGDSGPYTGSSLFVGTLQDLPPQNGYLLADTSDLSSSMGATLLRFAAQTYTSLNGSVVRSSSAFVSNSIYFTTPPNGTILVVQPLRWSVDVHIERQTFTVLDLFGALSGILSIATATYLFIVGKGPYSSRGLMHFLLQSPPEPIASVASAETNRTHMEDCSAASGIELMPNPSRSS